MLHIKKWYSNLSILLCCLLVIQPLAGMVTGVDVLAQAGLLLSRASLCINACRALNDLTYIQEFLNKHAISHPQAIYIPSTKSWEYLQLASDTNKLLIPCGYTLTYDILSQAPLPKASSSGESTSASVTSITVPSAPFTATFQDTNNQSYYVEWQPSIYNPEQSISFKNPLDNLTPEQESCFRLQLKLDKSNYDSFTDQLAAYNLRVRHIEQACRENKAYKQWFIDNIQQMMRHFLDCNAADILTRLQARLIWMPFYAQYPLDPPFEFVCRIAAYECIARYFNRDGSLATLDEDPELLWSIRTLARTRLCGTAYGYWAIKGSKATSSLALVKHNIKVVGKNFWRGLRCAFFDVPEPKTITSNKDNQRLLQIIRWCEQEEWDKVIADPYLGPGGADNPDFICKCITTIRKQELNKYKINKLADKDPLWQVLSPKAKKLATNTPQKRQLLIIYFRLRHDLRTQEKNPDELELSMLAHATIQQAANQAHQQVDKRKAGSCIVKPEVKPLPCASSKHFKNREDKIVCGSSVVWNLVNQQVYPCGTSKSNFKFPLRSCGSKIIIVPIPSPASSRAPSIGKVYFADSIGEEKIEEVISSLPVTPEELFLNEIRKIKPDDLTDEQINEFIKNILELARHQDPEFDIVDINWKHIIEGEKKTGRLSGYHTVCKCPEKVRRIKEMPCKHGVYEIEWGQGESAKIKDSTMFPINWDIITIIEKIIEVCLNPKRIDRKILGTYIEGKTSDGVSILIWISSQQIIDTAYPLLKGSSACCH